MQTIMQTRQDIENAPKKQRLEFLRWLQGAATVTVDTANYPEDYDSQLQEGEEGYVAPLFKEQQDTAVLERYGFSSITEVDACINKQ